MRRRRREESRGGDDESDYTHLKLSHFCLVTAALLSIIVSFFRVFPPLRPVN